MHIVYLYPHFTYPGGAGIFVLETAKRLRKKGIHISIITQTVTTDIVEKYKGLDFRCIGGPLPNTISFWMQYLLIYKKVERILDEINPDFVFPHVFPANYWGFLYKKHNPKVPCFWFCQEPSAFIHDIQIIDGLPILMRFLAKVSNPLMKLIDQNLVNYADYVFVNSDYSYNQCKKTYNLSKIERIYPGLDITEFPPYPPEKEDFFLCVSRLTKFKRIDIVIRALYHLKQKGVNIKLIIAGDGEEMNNLKTQSDKLGLSNKIFFLGKIERDLLISYYSKAIAVIFPSVNEPFGIVPIEAQAAWTTVIATKSGGPVESIVDGTTGYLIIPGSDSELENRMQYLISNKHIAIQMGINARKRVGDKFSWDQSCEQLFHAFTYYENNK